MGLISCRKQAFFAEKKAIMKIRIIMLMITMVTIAFYSCSEKGKIGKDYLGNWTFEVPDAEPGYTYGIAELYSDSIVTTFTGNKFRYPSLALEVRNDSVFYQFNIDGIDVFCALKIENRQSIKGITYWSSGESELTFSRME